MTGHHAVDIYRGFDMRALKKEYHAVAAPCSGNGDRAAVPCAAYVMFVGGEKERKLHAARPAVWLHVGIVIIGGVVDTPHPAGLQREVVALATGEHGPGQLYVVIIPARGIAPAVTVYPELPVAAKVYGVLGIGTCQCHEH